MTVKSTLARLLANENIEVREGNYQTASFDVVNRILNLPLWKDKGADVQDLLIGHEVGHALFTPKEGWHDSEIDVEGIPRSFLNIIEDIRIERMIRSKYPGLVKSFQGGYKVLFDENFFGTQDREYSSYGLPDRINIKAKLNQLVDITFDKDELPVVKKCFSAETWEEVVDAARSLLDYVGVEKQQDQPENQNENPEGDENEESMEQSSEEVPSTESQAGMPESKPDDKGSEQQEVTEAVEEHDSSDSDEDVSKDIEEGFSSNAGAGNEIVETDEAFRSKESDLLESHDGDSSPVVVRSLTLKEAKSLVAGYKTLIDTRNDENTHWYQRRYLTQSYDEFLAETKSVVNTMAREFEMKKAAYRYSRSRTSKTGSIDVTKLYSYKYNEDIFARTTKLADAKNHGLVMLVDYSGSMDDCIANVKKQAINIAHFCRKVNIPFRVYGFTSNGLKERNFKHVIDWESMSLFELLSNEMSKNDFETACYQIYNFHESTHEMMGGTPLNQALIAMHTLIPDFRDTYGLDKVNFTLLSDGDTNAIRYNYEQVHDMNDGYFNSHRMVFTVGGERINCKTNYAGTQTLVESLKKHTGCNTVCYFLTNRANDVRYRLYRSEGKGYDTEQEIRPVLTDWRKGGVSVDDQLGFDRYFFLRTTKLDTATTDFAPKDDSKGALTREFKKFAKSKKGNRVLASKFAEMVA